MCPMLVAEAIISDKLKFKSWINFLTRVNFPFLIQHHLHSFEVLEAKNMVVRTLSS